MHVLSNLVTDDVAECVVGEIERVADHVLVCSKRCVLVGPKESLEMDFPKFIRSHKNLVAKRSRIGIRVGVQPSPYVKFKKGGPGNLACLKHGLGSGAVVCVRARFSESEYLRGKSLIQEGKGLRAGCVRYTAKGWAGHKVC